MMKLETYQAMLWFQRKYNLEKGQKGQYWNIFPWALKIWEITSKKQLLLLLT